MAQLFVARMSGLLPGLGLCAGGAAAASVVHLLVPAVSPLLVAIALGAVLVNVRPLPAVVEPGLALAARRLLRLGVVLLGSQLLLADVLGLGAGMIGVVVAVVGGGIALTVLAGRWMGVSPAQTLLVACGFSICGAAAVAAADGVVDAEEEEVATAVALVVVFGTLMIPLVPALAGVLQLSERDGGLWAGGAIHEVAQVVAAGGALGGSALGGAVTVKLARVLMLAPVMAVLGWRQRRAAGRDGEAGPAAPLVPLFVVGFIAMVALRSTGLVPAGIVDAARIAETALLSAAMFALGCGVRIGNLRRVGPRPVALAAVSTTVVASISLCGVLLVG